MEKHSVWRIAFNKQFSRLRRTTENTSLLTTNQKVAGSSPAERAPKSPANAGISPLRINLKVGLCHLTHHLALFGTASQGACRCDLDVPVLDPVRLHYATGILFLATVIRAAASSTVCSGGGRHRSRPTILNPCLDISTLQSSVQRPTTRSFLRSESRAGRHYSILGNRINDRY